MGPGGQVVPTRAFGYDAEHSVGFPGVEDESASPASLGVLFGATALQ